MTTEVPSGPTGLHELLAHEPWLRRLVAELVDDHMVEDVLQDTWAAALIRGPGRLVSPRAWLRRVARNQAYRRRRTEVRRRQRESAAARPEAVPSAESMVARLQAHRRVAEAVMELEEPYRSAVLLRYFEDLSPREIARRLGVPGSTVRSRLERGLARVRGRLEGADVRALAIVILTPRAGEMMPPASPVPALAQLTTGGLAMMTRHKVLSAAVVVLFVGLGTWAVAGSSGDPVPSRDVTRLAAPGAPTEEFESREMPAERATIPVEAPAEPAPGALRGLVTDPFGRPVVGVPVVFVATSGSGLSWGRYGVIHAHDRGDPIEIAVSGPTGEFAAPVEAEFGRLTTSGDWVAVRSFAPAAESRASREARLVVAPRTTLTGVVRDPDGVPLAGVSVHARVDGLLDYPEPLADARPVALARTSTDGAGRFALEGVPALDELRVAFDREGHESQVHYELASRGHVEIVLERVSSGYHLVEGVVEDRAGRAMVGATVVLGRTVVRTNRHGEFAVRARELAPDARFGAGLPGHEVVERPDVVAALRAGEDVGEVVLRLGPPVGTASARVVDHRGRPLEGWVATLQDAVVLEPPMTAESFAAGREAEIRSLGGTPMRADATTDVDGSFTLDGLSDRLYTVLVFDPHTLRSATSTLSPGGAPAVIEIEESGERTVAGVVVSRAGRALPGVSVVWGLRTLAEGPTLFAPRGRTTTDADGRFVLPGVPVGELSLSLSGEAVTERVVPIPPGAGAESMVVTAGQPCSVRFRVEDPRATRVRLLDVDGEPIELVETLEIVSFAGDSWRLIQGRTPVLTAPDDAVTAVSLRGSVELGRCAVQLTPGRVTTVRL